MNFNKDMLYNKFSVPFTGDDPEEFLCVINKYMPYIHDVYLGHRVFPQCHFYKDDNPVERFLSINNGRIPVYFTMNATFNNINETAAQEMIESTNILHFLNLYKIKGIIVAEASIAAVMKRKMPNLSIHTSVNSALINQDFNDFPEVDAVQLPRGVFFPTSNIPNAKVMLNEACFRNCAFTRSHILAQTFLQKDKECSQCTDNIESVACINLCLPHWVPQIAPRVKLLKIAGRPSTNKWLDGCLSAYINCNDENLLLSDICTGICQYKSINLPLSIYEDAMINCSNNPNCNFETCKIRAKMLKKISLLTRLNVIDKILF